MPQAPSRFPLPPRASRTPAKIPLRYGGLASRLAGQTSTIVVLVRVCPATNPGGFLRGIACKFA